MKSNKNGLLLDMKCFIVVFSTLLATANMALSEIIICQVEQVCTNDKCIPAAGNTYTFDMAVTDGWENMSEGAFQQSVIEADLAKIATVIYPNGISIITSIGNDGSLARTTHIPRDTGVVAMRIYKDGELKDFESGPKGSSITVIRETGKCGVAAEQ